VFQKIVNIEKIRAKLKNALNLLFGFAIIASIIMALIYVAGKIGFFDEPEFSRCGEHKHWKVTSQRDASGDEETSKECVFDKPK
jgi:hypothetical protein